MAGTNNFQQWNPTSANQESDAAYTSDSLRSGGAGTGAIFPSNTANKLFFQLAQMVCGLAGMMANKGYNVSDANLSNLTTALTNILTNADVAGNLIRFSDVPGYLYRLTDITKGNNSNGYWIKDANSGFIKQWGHVTTDINNGQLTVPFPVAFTNAASISVVATTLGASTFDRIVYIINGSVNINSFIIANNGSGGFANWIAEGY